MRLRHATDALCARRTDGGFVITPREEVWVEGDVRLALHASRGRTHSLLAYAWLHTAFVDPLMCTLTFAKPHLDQACKDSACRTFGEGFRVTLRFGLEPAAQTEAGGRSGRQLQGSDGGAGVQEGRAGEGRSSSDVEVEVDDSGEEAAPAAQAQDERLPVLGADTLDLALAGLGALSPPQEVRRGSGMWQPASGEGAGREGQGPPTRPDSPVSEGAAGVGEQPGVAGRAPAYAGRPLPSSSSSHAILRTPRPPATKQEPLQAQAGATEGTEDPGACEPQAGQWGEGGEHR